MKTASASVSRSSQINKSKSWWSVSPRQAWGTGYDPGAIPIRHGWRIAPANEGATTIIIGKDKHQGCASVMRHPDGKLDVALWMATPKQVSESFNRETPSLHAPVYIEMDTCEGWALIIIVHLASNQIIKSL